MSAQTATELDEIRSVQYLGTQYLLSRCLHCAVELEVADHLGETSEPIDALAGKIDAHADSLNRLIRYLAANGVFTYTGGRVGHSPRSRLLRADHPRSQRAWLRQVGSTLSWDLLGILMQSVRTGRPALEKLHPEGLFAYFSKHPEDAARFNEGMSSKSLADIAAVLRAYDFSGYGKIVDVGGGRGHLLRAVLANAPNATGVLFDLPAVIKGVESLRSTRLSLQGGDFFRDELPPGDIYLLMNVIHNWADAEAISILRAVRKACPPKGARVLLLEILLPEEPRRPSLRDMQNLDMDIAMLVFTGARERARHEYEALLERAGLRLARVIDTDSGLSVLEAVSGEV